MSDRRFLKFVSKDIDYYGVGIAPHSVTIRNSYTCPTGKVAVVEGAYVRVHRATAATVVGHARTYITLTRFGQTSLIILFVGTRGNVVDTGEILSLSAPFTLQGGDVVAIRTADDSTGGTVDYTASILISEYE